MAKGLILSLLHQPKLDDAKATPGHPTWRTTGQGGVWALEGVGVGEACSPGVDY